MSYTIIYYLFYIKYIIKKVIKKNLHYHQQSADKKFSGKVDDNMLSSFGTRNSNLPSQRISFGMSDFAEILTNLQFVTAASQIVSLK